MEKEPLFFVFTCIKDGEKYINKLLISLINQKRKNFIHYIYDDGSSKPLTPIIEEYKKEVLKLDNPYKIYFERNKTNIGLNLATAHCIQKVNLPYFIWIDCDNYVDENFFFELEKIVKKYPEACLIRTLPTHINERGEILKNDCHNKICNIKKSTAILPQILINKYIWSPFVVKTSDFLSINPNSILESDKLFFNDQQVLICLSLLDKKIVFAKKCNSFILIRNDSEFSQTGLITSDERIEKTKTYVKKLNYKLKYELSIERSCKIAEQTNKLYNEYIDRHLIKYIILYTLLKLTCYSVRKNPSISREIGPTQIFRRFFGKKNKDAI